MMKFSIAGNLENLFGKIKKQAAYAGMLSLNDAAFIVKGETSKDMGYKFVSPTPWVMKGLYVKQATKSQLTATVGVNDANTSRGKRPQINTLRQHYSGGRRTLKAFEIAFQRIGLMPSGWFAVTGSGAKYIGAVDDYGNLRKAFIIQLIAYFNAFKDQGKGRRKNMTDKARAKMAGVETVDGLKRIGGVVFFVSRGKAGGPHEQHLAPGIWAKSGTHGRIVRPIIMFVSSANYSQRIDMPENAHRVMNEEYAMLFSRRFKTAMATAR